MWPTLPKKAKIATKSCNSLRVIVKNCEPDSARSWPVKNWLASQADLILVIGHGCWLIKYMCQKSKNVLCLGPPVSSSVTGFKEDVAQMIKGGFTKEIIYDFVMKDEQKSSRKVFKGKISLGTSKIYQALKPGSLKMGIERQE